MTARDGTQNAEFMKRVLVALSANEREALSRYYLQRQATEQICRDLGFDPGRFRELKLRVRRAFRERNVAILYTS